MASIDKKKNGFYRAQWLDGKGSKRSQMTAHTDPEAALKEANHLEAVCRFWEAANDGVLDFMAQIGFSPQYAHANFTHKAHLSLTEFRKLIRESGIEFQKPSQWKDSANPRHKKRPREE
jgi:hypothetical protein